jgi:hypothetical protein
MQSEMFIFPIHQYLSRYKKHRVDGWRNPSKIREQSLAEVTGILMQIALGRLDIRHVSFVKM